MATQVGPAAAGLFETCSLDWAAMMHSTATQVGAAGLPEIVHASWSCNSAMTQCSPLHMPTEFHLKVRVRLLS